MVVFYVLEGHDYRVAWRVGGGPITRIDSATVWVAIAGCEYEIDPTELYLVERIDDPTRTRIPIDHPGRP